MAATTSVRARVEEDLRDDASAILKALGLTISDVLRMTLTRVVHDWALPFELTQPNAETITAIEEARKIRLDKRQRLVSE
jgi:DNA-damage-inducible protein J